MLDSIPSSLLNHCAMGFVILHFTPELVPSVKLLSN